MNKFDINKLSIQEKIGQLFMIGFDALDLNDHVINMIKNYKVGNIILFARNIKTPQQVFDLNKKLQKLALENNDIPLFISIDQEGGMVSRITSGGTYFPGAMTLAATNDDINAYLSALYMGKELKSLGINLNLAPVLDINSNPKNPVIGVRSFSSDKDVVSDFGVSFVKGMQESVIATAKHFPGHGDTNLDSHLALPKIDISLERLHDVELVPFKAAIDNGIKAIMSAHINFPNLTENGYPTTLSHNVLTGLLREELKFEGLIVTDCMQMKAIQDNYTTKEASLMTIKAGANLVCVSHAEELQTAAIERVLKAFNDGEISVELINERLNRVLKFKNDISLNLDQEYIEVKANVEDDNTKLFALNTVKSAVTLVKGNAFTKKGKVLLISPNPKSTSIADETDGHINIVQHIKNEIPSFDTLEISIRLNNEEIQKTIEKAKDFDQIILCTYNANIYSNQIRLINELANMNKELHVLAMRNPYDLDFTDKIKNYVCFYEYTPNSVKALSEYLKGNLILTGKSPIKNG